MKTLRGYGRGGYGQTGAMALADALAGTPEEFRMGAMEGRYVSAPFYAPGSRLDGDWSRLLETRVNVGAVSFVIFSYETPIAWHDDELGEWIIPDESYSPTTSKQQSKIRTALAFMGKDYTE